MSVPTEIPATQNDEELSVESPPEAASAEPEALDPNWVWSLSEAKIDEYCD